MEPTYSHADFSSSSYRWRLPKEGRILATIFSQTFPLGYGTDPMLRKVIEKDEAYGNMDVDAKELKNLFKNDKLFPVPVDVVYKTALSFEKVKKYLKNIKEEAYDCFFFCFLTYTQPENTGANFHDERLHFDDSTLEKGIVSFAKVLDEVKDMKVAVGKPKVFLIQADDVSFLAKKQHPKGPTAVPVVTKIPQDADRLIIKSTIPQRIASWDPEGKEYTNNKTIPSFLVQAFMEAVRENATKTVEEADDFLTMTTSVNEKVKRMIDKSKHTRADDLLVPLTTSTFTKLLYLRSA